MWAESFPLTKPVDLPFVDQFIMPIFMAYLVVWVVYDQYITHKHYIGRILGCKTGNESVKLSIYLVRRLVFR